MPIKEMIWENKEHYGCEYLKLENVNNDIDVEGTVIYVEHNIPYKVSYKLQLDNHWTTRKCEIIVNSTRKLLIISDGLGQWLDHEGRELTELNGAIDVDISATPFSNSLPINRVDWKLNQSKEFEMVYIDVPTLEIHKIQQRYTYMGREEETRIFNYHCRDFESLIYVDDDGLVIDYPLLFKRKA